MRTALTPSGEAQPEAWASRLKASLESPRMKSSALTLRTPFSEFSPSPFPLASLPSPLPLKGNCAGSGTPPARRLSCGSRCKSCLRRGRRPGVSVPA
eukprot:13772956-Alexandrium_andersonii.AAC.1